MATLKARPATPERDEQLSQEQRRAFGKWDEALHALDYGPRWLEVDAIAQLVADSLRYWHEQRYILRASCIMPNHVHVVFTPLLKDNATHYSLAAIMHTIKRYTALEANRLLGQTGDFWQHESHDHVVRDANEYRRIVAYLLNNPVKAGMVREWQDWPWNYLTPDADL